MSQSGTRLKALLKQRHLQEYKAFCRDYDRVAAELDEVLVGRYPSKATFYRWLSGDGLVGLPRPDHCRVVEVMFPDWRAAELFTKVDEAASGLRAEPAAPADRESGNDLHRPVRLPSDLVAMYAHRSDTPKQLWLDMLKAARERIDLFAYASLFLPEDNPGAIRILKEKAKRGVQIRILLGDPNNPAAELRGREERLFEGILGRIKMALAYYRPLLDVEGISFRLHGTSLYNSVFRYDDEMLVNQHIYGTYGYIAPILHLRRDAGSDLFDTYMNNLDLVWNEESWEFKPAVLSG